MFRILSKEALYRLKPGCRAVKPENMIPTVGVKFCIHSPWSDSYYQSEIREYTDWRILEVYINQQNVYVDA